MPEEIFEVYKDSGLKERLAFFDVGEAEVGRKTVKIFYLKNITGGNITELTFKITSPYVTILEAPKTFEPEEVKQFKIEIAPPLGLKKGIRADVLIKAEIKYLPEDLIRKEG